MNLYKKNHTFIMFQYNVILIGKLMLLGMIIDFKQFGATCLIEDQLHFIHREGSKIRSQWFQLNSE